MADENALLPGMIPLDEDPPEEGETLGVTPIFTGGLFGPQMLLMRRPEEDGEEDPNP